MVSINTKTRPYISGSGANDMSKNNSDATQLAAARRYKDMDCALRVRTSRGKSGLSMSMGSTIPVFVRG